MSEQTTIQPDELDREWARRISASLIPHTTSVHNVEIIAAAIAAARHRGAEDAEEERRCARAK